MSDRKDIEDTIAAALRDGDMEAAATACLEGYGGELLGFMFTLCRDRDLAHESYADFCEDLWRGLPGFRGDSPCRAWCFRLARNACMRQLRHPNRKPARNVALSAVPHVLAVAEAVRTATPLHLRSEVKAEVRRLREQLSPDEQALLTLRIDKRMSWNDIAAVFADGELDDAGLRTLGATLRKRYERIKLRLRRLASDEG